MQLKLAATNLTRPQCTELSSIHPIETSSDPDLLDLELYVRKLYQRRSMRACLDQSR